MVNLRKRFGLGGDAESVAKRIMLADIISVFGSNSRPVRPVSERSIGEF
ncbi:MAG: hypothetical protein IIC31_06275 [Chloroflexi bacterium]|nr:hypothetical protein [Chloroflexota bacterium]